ncbi:hypothetical protein [Pelotalea chapellei]|uniref:Uncharacterized protein n=1 Tax=Pelotalea chapellei TaxID=44671 RepID=A0ABS5U7I2_9BACT|nr:hypothetical protein [Pelotalea chapellei]MBT1071625.1 hypothetical protein [Pelotalea chapellei]
MAVLFTPLVTWLIGFATVYLVAQTNAGMKLLQGVFDTIITFSIQFISLFPDCVGSCLEAVNAPVSGAVLNSFLMALNWVFPVTFFISLVNFMTCGLMAFVAIAPVARWLKLLN